MSKRQKARLLASVLSALGAACTALTAGGYKWFAGPGTLFWIGAVYMAGRS